MPIFYGKVALIESLKSIKTPNSTIGFVPTMGRYIKASFINAAIIG
jgi:pantothenate synthetase